MKIAIELLGQIVDCSAKYICFDYGQKTKFACKFCNAESKTPDTLKHEEGCLIAQAKEIILREQKS